MKTSHRIYLRRDTKRGHEDVTVLIDWTNVSDRDIKLMASHYVLHRAERDLKGYDNALPESIEYRAADFVHNEPLVQLPEAPESWKSGTDKVEKKSKAKVLKDALALLSPAELAELKATFK